jgi:isopentenyl-diphosphate Delta-isomerase
VTFNFSLKKHLMSTTATTTIAANNSTIQATGSSFAELVQGLSAEDILRVFPEVTRSAINGSTQGSSGAEDNSLFAGHDEEQIKLMDEVCIVLDWNDDPVGFASKKTCHIMSNIEKGLLHRAFSVFLFNHENKLLLQQRADEKITFPGMWTNTCCSHPLAIASEQGHDLASSVEGVKNAAQRKLDHELGINKKYVPIDNFDFLTRIHYVAPSNGPWGEHEIDYILITKADPVLSINPNEVKDTRYVSKDELKQMFADKDLKFTPWFKLICENYLFQWWERLDNLKPLQESHIQRML